MIEWLSSPEIWASLLTLVLLEIVLGIDNLLFIAILAGRLPDKAAQARARRLGLVGALVTRLALLASIAWLAGLTKPIFAVAGHGVSWRDIVLVGGGFFLLYKGTHEIHRQMEGDGEGAPSTRPAASFVAVVVQIMLLDIVFSLDSVITAVGMAQHLSIMAAAIVVAVAVMLVAAGPVARFVNRHPTVRMLALSFLLLIGMSLVADGFGFHVPKGYIYAAIGFSLAVEVLNQLAARARRKRALPRDAGASALPDAARPLR